MGSGIIQYFLNKSILVNLMTVLILIVGAYTASNMNREAFPNIDFDIVSVSTLYPGASPSEIEKLVTNPIEKALKQVDGIKEIRSSSLENRSGIIIKIDPDVKNTNKVVDDIRAAVDRVEDLPQDAEEPIATEITTARQPVIEVHIWSNRDENGNLIMNERQLREKAKELENYILEMSGVARVTKRGFRDIEMQVQLNPERLQAYQMSSQQVINSLRNRNINFPGGNISNNGKETIVRTVAEFDLAEEIQNVYIRSNDAGRSLMLKDVAKVEENLREADYADRSNGNLSVVLTVIKRQKADAIKIVDETKVIVEKYMATQGQAIGYSYVNDLSKFIRRRLGVLVNNAVQGLILVTGSLFLFLGWRMATMTALGIPISIGITFFVLNYLGITLNLISMLGLIIVIGILVDDAIIICENVYRYIEKGMEPYEAALKGTSEVVAPVTATITTTIAAFAPMLFMTGIFGKFIYSIPLVVIVALLSSLFEAFFILPSHLYDISKASNMDGEFKEESTWFTSFKNKFYLPALKFSLKHNFVTLGAFIFTLIFAIVLQVKFGKFKLFPGAIETFQVKLTAETGLTLEETEKFIQAIEFEIKKLPKEELENYVARIGIIQKDPNDPFTKRGKHYAQLLVYLTPDDKRKRGTEEIINSLRSKCLWLLNDSALKVALEKDKRQREFLKSKGSKVLDEISVNYDEVPDPSFSSLKKKLLSLEFEKLAGGPPVGKPVALEIKGDDFATLQKISEEYKDILVKIKGVEDIGDDFTEGKEEIRISIEEDIASRAGVNIAQIATAINAAFQGAVATKIKRTDEEVDVRVRFPQEYRNSIDSLNKIYVSNMAGNLIPVSRMATYEKSPGRSAINHLDGKRLLTVAANIDETVTTSQKVNQELKKLAAGIIDKYPGYTMNYGGENKDTEESLASLGRAFLVGLMIIFMVLANLFRSLAQPILVMSAIPFSFIGVIFAFLFHGEYLSFLSFLGIIGLAGVVVNDSIVLVDYANSVRLRDPSMPIFDVLMETGNVRLRAVSLTTVTTVLGLLPTAYGIGGKDPFLVPMALAFGWGLMFASLITLLAVPVFYMMLYDFKAFLKRVFRFKKSVSNTV